MKTEDILTAESLHRALLYEPDTGIFRWRVTRSTNAKAGDVAGTTKADGYRQLSIYGFLMLAHRAAWCYVHGEWPKHDIDHINGDIIDNRIANLRDVPRLLNMQNQRRAQAKNATGFLGVTQDKKRGTYHPKIRIPGEKNPRHLGTFRTAEAAHEAYLEAKRKLHAGCTI